MITPYQDTAFQRFDWRVFELVHREWSPEWLDPIMKMISDTGLGHIKLVFILPFIFWRRTRPLGLFMLYAGLVSGALNLIMKELMGRWRPGRFAGLTEPLEIAILAPAFPSGHTTTSFGIAFAVVFLLAGTHRAWIGYLVTLWAALVGYSRMYVGVHWLSDVLAGVCFGALGACIVAWAYHLRGKWEKFEPILAPAPLPRDRGSETPPGADA
jgi:undecaprenyl-diphosphatase